MSKTVADLKDGVAGLLTGTNVNNVTNIYRAFERALGLFLQKASIPESSTSQIFTIYDGVYNYLSPSYIFGGAIRDFRPIGATRFPDEFTYRQPIAVFDRTKACLPNGTQMTFETENGINYVRISSSTTKPRIILDPMTSTTGWVAAGGASSLVADSTFFYSGNASLRFNLAASPAGTLTKTLTTPIDLTSYQGVGVVFLALEIPSTSLTSVEFRIGSDASNYYKVTATQGFVGAWQAGDFSLTAFNLSAATTVGSPVITAMDYMQTIFTPSGAMNNVRVGSLWISLPCPHKMFFETTAVFQNSTSSVISNVIGADNDTILLNDSAYNIYEMECAITVGLQMGGSISTGLVGNLSSQLNGARARNGSIIALGLYDLYRSNNPSEELRVVDSYYDI